MLSNVLHNQLIHCDYFNEGIIREQCTNCSIQWHTKLYHDKNEHKALKKILFKQMLYKLMPPKKIFEECTVTAPEI